MAKTGPKKRFIVNEAMLERIKELAARGLSKKDVARALGFGHDTYFAHQRKHPEMYDAYDEGAALGLEKVTNSLFEQALDGNVTAIIWFLKNRRPEEWADRIENRNINEHRLSVISAQPDPQTDEEWLKQHSPNSTTSSGDRSRARKPH